MKRWTGSALGLLALACTLLAQDAGLELSGLNTARYGWGKVLNQQNVELDRIYREDVLDLDLGWKNFRVNLAGVAQQPAEFPDARDEGRVEGVDLIRRSIEWTGPVTVRVGHSWTTFGNGLALSLYRDDNLENPRLTGTQRDEQPTTWDSGIDGLFVEGHWDRLSVKALWGNRDVGPFEDSGYYGTLGGANAEYHHELGTLGGSWVRSDGVPVNVQDDVPVLLDLESREVYGQLQVGPLDLSLNHVDQHRKDDLLGTVAPNAGAGGLATYGALGLALGEWYLQGEYKYYRFALPTLYMHNPPIVQQEIPSRLIARHRRLNAFDDETGWQLTASRWFEAGQELTLQAAVSSHIDDSMLPSLEEALSAYREVTAGWTQELDAGRHLALSLAYAEETNGFVEDSAPRTDGKWSRRLAVGGSLRTPLPLVGAVEFSGELLRDEEVHLDETTTAGLFWVDVFPRSDLSVNVTADYEEESDAQRDWMASMECRYDFSTGASLDHSLTVFAGRLRGGLVCSSGNCRVVAPFDGVKLTLASRF